MDNNREKWVKGIMIAGAVIAILGFVTGKFTCKELFEGHTGTGIEDMQIIVNTGLGNIRTGPGLNYKIIKAVPLGTKLTAIAEDTDEKERTWYKVNVPGKSRTGWISSRITD